MANDGLPTPVTVTDELLVAVVMELRALRGLLSAAPGRSDGAVPLTEPKGKRKRRD